MTNDISILILTEVAVLSAVDDAEDGAFTVGGAGQEGDVRSVLAGSEAGGVVRVASYVVDYRCEPNICRCVEVGS